MYLKSPYPDPPVLPHVNAHYILFKRPDQPEWPDYAIHVDAVSGEQVMYRDFLSQIDDLATGLGAPISQGGLGVRAEDGEIVGIMGENSSDYIALMHSCLKIATPFAPISSYSTPYELKHALTLTKPTRLFVDAKFLKTVLPVAEEVGFDLRVIYVMRGHAKGHQSLWNIIKDARAKRIPAVDTRPATKDTLAYLVFSSGTTGLPKAVMISHGNVTSAISRALFISQMITEISPLAPAIPRLLPITLAFLPLHHAYGLFVCCLHPCLTPSTLVLMPKWDIDVALSAIPKYKISILTLIPSVIHQLVNHPGIKKVDFSSVISVASGAAYLPPELGEKMSSVISKNVNVVEGYGMSEACSHHAATTQPYDGLLGGKLKRIVGCPGVLLPGMEARTVRDDGSEADVNEPGELWLRGDTIALGYWNNEKASKETFVDGWLHTGDRFRVDNNGNFWFADRAKDTLKVSGTQVSPVEIENCLLEHPDKLITDATVAGVSGGRTSDEKIPRAWIVLSPAGKKLGASAVVKELRSWCQENLSKYKWLRGGIEVVKAIPKSPTGKTLRRVLQDEYEESAKRGPKSKL